MLAEKGGLRRPGRWVRSPLIASLLVTPSSHRGALPLNTFMPRSEDHCRAMGKHYGKQTEQCKAAVLALPLWICLPLFDRRKVLFLHPPPQEAAR